MRVDAAASSLAARIGGTPDLEPLRDLLASKALRGSPAAGSLRALGEGGWWTQSKLFEEGADGISDPYCRACGQEDGQHQSIGTLHHRFCMCPATGALREGYGVQDVISKAQGPPHCDEPLYKHGVPVLLLRPPAPAEDVRWCGGRPPPGDVTFTGHAFTGRAMRGRAPRAERRAGWACVLVDAEAKVVAGLYGPCPDPFPSSLRAELRAIIQLLPLASPPLVIWVDKAVRSQRLGSQARVVLLSRRADRGSLAHLLAGCRGRRG